MFGKRIHSKWNIIIRVLLAIVVLLLVMSIIYTLLIPKKFEVYQTQYIDNILNEINSVEKDEVVENIVKLRNEYRFDAIVYDKEVLLYSSGDVYEIESANNIYSDGYIYKGSHEYEGYLIWVIVYTSDISAFVNSTLTQNLIIIITQTILMLIVIYIIMSNSVKPLNMLSEIVVKLKNSSSAIKHNEDLDEISSELIKASNDLKLKLYYSKKEEKEFERRYNQQSELLYEQKNYLANIVHDVKSTFAAIKFSSRFLNDNSQLKEYEKKALNSIENSSSSALDLITSSLDNVINNEYSIYIDKTDVSIKTVIEEYFEFNNMLLFEKQLKVDVTGEEVTLNINAIKFDQVINNILSNMIKYSKDKSTLKISVNKEMCTFTNEIGRSEKQYSNSFGLNSIDELCKNIDLEYNLTIGEKQAVSKLYYRGDKND